MLGCTSRPRRLPNSFPEHRAKRIGNGGARQFLEHAIELRPEYGNAMAYLNLLYRRKADTASYQDERDGLLKLADDLVDKVKEIKKKGAEQPTRLCAGKEF